MVSRFAHVAPSPGQERFMVDLGEAFQIAEKIVNEVPAGRYRSLALTHLEIAAMFANKAIMHPEE